MAFGQSSGPPATGRQLSELVELLEAAGHSDFRDARGPMGFNQRQAAGKFTRDEADMFIEQLQAEVYGDGPPTGSTEPDASKVAPPQSKVAKRRPPTNTPAKRRATATNRQKPNLRDVSSEALAAELQRRGWVVMEP